MSPLACRRCYPSQPRLWTLLPVVSEGKFKNVQRGPPKKLETCFDYSVFSIKCFCASVFPISTVLLRDLALAPAVALAPALAFAPAPLLNLLLRLLFASALALAPPLLLLLLSLLVAVAPALALACSNSCPEPPIQSRFTRRG